MNFGIFAIHFLADGKTLLTFKRQFDGSMAEILSLEQNHKKENLFFCPFEVHFGKAGSGWKPQEADFKSSEWLTLDLDGVEETGGDTHREVVAAIESFLPIDPMGERYYIWTGNGLQALYRITRQTSKFYKPANRARYRHFAALLSDHLIEVGINFKEVDTRIFEPTRLHRLPGTINNKPDKGPKMAILLDAINEDSGEPNSALLEWFLGLPSEPSHTQTPSEAGKSKIEPFLQGIGAVCRGNYWLMPCPFHKPDKKPSFAYYPGTDRGVDFHCEKGHGERIRNFEQIYLAVTGKKIDEFRAEFGIKALTPAIEIVKNFIIEKLAPTHFTRQGLFSQRFDMPMGVKAIQESPNEEILENLKNSVEFAAKIKKSPNIDLFDFTMALYRSRVVLAVGAFKEIYPIKNFVTAKNRDQVVIKRRLNAILHRTITISIDGGGFITGLGRENSEGTRQHLKKCSIFSFAKSIAQADQEEWLRIGHYDAFVRLSKKGKVLIAIRYVLLADLDKEWYEEFTSSRDFTVALKEANIGLSKSIWTEGKPLRVVVLSDKFSN